MLSILKTHHQMNIVGQGGKIILFMLPSLIAAIWLHVKFPGLAALPEGVHFLRPLGYVLLVPSVALWATAVVQLLTGFPKGELVTTGAYSIVRNPIYASAALGILPAVSLLSMTWVYLIVSAFLYMGVSMFIGVEEKQLTKAFGRTYEAYLKKVDRLIPFKKPSSL